jgi:subtilisin family serine protease
MEIETSETVQISARFLRELSRTERAEIEELGVEFRRVAGKLAHLDRFYYLSVPVHAVEALALHPLTEWLEAAWQPVVAVPLDLSVPASNVPAVWQLSTGGTLSTQMTGQGVTIADFDTGVDVEHPDLWDGTYNMGPNDCMWDQDGNGVFQPGGVDTFPFTSGVLRKWDPLGDPNNTAGYEPTQDWVYLDDNPANGLYDTGEFVYMAHDVNGNGIITTMPVSECLRSLGNVSPGLPNSKVAATLNAGGVQRTRGVDLELTALDTNGHGTGVAGILVGGNACLGAMTPPCNVVYPNTRRYVGVAPDADLLMADAFSFNVDGSYIPWAAGLGANVMLYEYGSWTYHYMDGSSNHEQVMDQASANGIVQVVPTGNLYSGGLQSARHFQYFVPAAMAGPFGYLDHPFDVPAGPGITQLYASMVWLNPGNHMTVTITTTTGTAGNAVHLPCTTPGSWQGPFTTADGHDLYCQRAPDSTRGTALYNIWITRAAGVLTGRWRMRVGNYGSAAEKANFYIADDATSWGGGAVWFNESFLGWEGHSATWPSTCDSCIGVASYATRGYVDGAPVGQISWFSGRGARFLDGARIVDVTAPGHYDVISTASKDSLWGGPSGFPGKYTCGNPVATQGCFGGTSAAGPHVAGVAALMMQFANNRADPAGIEAAIQRGAVSDGWTGATPNDIWGYGKLDAHSAFLNLLPDLGDAPDSSNHFGVPMSAYPGAFPGVQANYPTVYTGTAPLGPPGPVHWQAGSWSISGPVDSCLGQYVSAEGEADTWFDEDPVSYGGGTNNISPTVDSADRENADPTHLSDDSLPFPGMLNHCASKQLNYYFTLAPGSVATHYVNVWIDWNHDGDWGDVFTCTTPGDTPEWVVQNQALSGWPPGGPHATSTPPFLSYRPGDPYDPAWIRISIAEQPAPLDPQTGRADGRGPAAGYQYGETEDHFLWYPPVAGFQASATTTCMSYTVSFTNTSHGSQPITYSWDMGDGTKFVTTTKTPFVYHYQLPGDFRVVMTATGRFGIMGSPPVWQWIHVDPSPKAGFLSNSPVAVSDTVVFTNTSLGATSYQWEFGDGFGTSAAINPTYVYTRSGTFVVTLVARNDEGCLNAYQDSVRVGAFKIFLPLVQRGYP